MNNYTDEQLDQTLGTQSRQFTKFKILSVDNGTDTAGTGATGDFVEKEYDEVAKKVERISFAPELEGIILSSQAQLIDKTKYPTWRTNEFDPSNTKAKIAIFPLQGGKFIKDPTTNQIKKNYTTYAQIKASRKVVQPDGSTQSTYNYLIVLYVGVEGEIMKLKFKGTSRSNFFDYSKHISTLGAKIYNIKTNFSTYIDKSTGKYAIKFDVMKDEKGVPISINPEEVRAMRIQVAQSFQAFSNKQINAPQKQALPEIETPTDNSEIKDEEVVKEEVEIPF